MNTARRFDDRFDVQVYGDYVAGTPFQELDMIAAVEDAIRLICEDQADSEDDPVTAGTVETAARLLIQIGDAIPQIAPGSDGSLGLLWRHDDTVAYVDILTNGYVRLFVREPGREDVSEVNIVEHVVPIAVTMIRSLFATDLRRDILPAQSLNHAKLVLA